MAVATTVVDRRTISAKTMSPDTCHAVPKLVVIKAEARLAKPTIAAKRHGPLARSAAGESSSAMAAEPSEIGTEGRGAAEGAVRA